MKNFFLYCVVIILFFSGIFWWINFEQAEKNISDDLFIKKPVIAYQYEDPKKPLSLLFTGDVMLDRYMRKTIKKRGYNHVIGKEMQKFFQNHSAVIINHEGVLSGKNPLKATPNMVQFTFPDSSIEFFKALGVTHANLGNNHSRDFGEIGEERTRKILLEQKIFSYGSAFNETESLSTIFTKKGYTIGMVSYNDIFPENFSGVIHEIQKIKSQVDILIVTTHWGIEYYSGIEDSQQKKAYQLIDAGADIIVGNHPHVVAPIEQYKNGMIFYSLGNFIFDQVFSEDVKRGLLLSIVVQDGKFFFYLHPTKMNKKFEISFMKNNEKKVFLKAIASVSRLPIETYGEIQEGVIHWRGVKK